MTTLYLATLFVHIIGAALLFGTGLGIAFFMMMAHRTRDARVIAATADTVVIADFLFTASAVVVQPLSGAILVSLAGYSFREPWIVAAGVLYLVAGACWLPVVAIQIRMRDLARQAVRNGSELPAAYHRLFAIWFALGWPAFIAVMLILADMVWKPAL